MEGYREIFLYISLSFFFLIHLSLSLLLFVFHLFPTLSLILSHFSHLSLFLRSWQGFHLVTNYHPVRFYTSTWSWGQCYMCVWHVCVCVLGFCVRHVWPLCVCVRHACVSVCNMDNHSLSLIFSEKLLTVYNFPVSYSHSILSGNSCFTLKQPANDTHQLFPLAVQSPHLTYNPAYLDQSNDPDHYP